MMIGGAGALITPAVPSWPPRSASGPGDRVGCLKRGTLRHRAGVSSDRPLHRFVLALLPFLILCCDSCISPIPFELENSAAIAAARQGKGSEKTRTRERVPDPSATMH